MFGARKKIIWEEQLFDPLGDYIKSLQALYLGGTPSPMTGTRPPSCIHLDNRRYIYVTDSHLKLTITNKAILALTILIQLNLNG